MLRRLFSVIMLVALVLCVFYYRTNYTSSVAFADGSIGQCVAYVPINITNTQNVATPSPFQVMITIDSSAYASYEAADLSNVAFIYPNGTVIPSWLESGNSNSSTDTAYWLNINGIAANSSVTIFLVFYPVTDNVLNNTTTGEAPALSPIYSEYDDGQIVFPVYGDFMNSFDGWQANQYTGDFTPSISQDGIEMVSGGDEATYLVSPQALPSSPLIIEEGWNYSGSAESNVISAFGTSLGGPSTALMTSESGAPILNNSISVIFDYFGANTLEGTYYPYIHINDYIANTTIGSASFTGSGDYNVTSFLAIDGKSAWAGYDDNYISLDEFNWTNPVTAASGSCSNPFGNSALIVSACSQTHPWLYTSSTQYIRWIIGRTMPPNNIEPSVALGNVVTAPKISILSPENNTYNTTIVPLTFTVDQTTSWLGYSLDGQSNVTVSGNTTLTGLADGVHNVIVFANNTANMMGASDTTFFTIQTLAITNVSQSPLLTNVTPTDIVSVNATVTDSVNAVTQVSLNYTTGNGTWITVNMTNLQGNIWNSVIPAYPYGTSIIYAVQATDSMGNTLTTQELGYNLHYTVVAEFTGLPIVFVLLITTLFVAVIYARKRSKTVARTS